jgi:hypothetical protein
MLESGRGLPCVIEQEVMPDRNVQGGVTQIEVRTGDHDDADASGDNNDQDLHKEEEHDVCDLVHEGLDKAVHGDPGGGPPAQFTTASGQVKGGEDGVQDVPTTMPPPGRRSPPQVLPSRQVPKIEVIVEQPGHTVNRSNKHAKIIDISDGPPQHEQLEQMPRFK